MRIKMKRKGSSLMDVLGKGKDVDRATGRSRSGTTSSVATSLSVVGNDQSPSPFSATAASTNSSKVNLRTRIADKFDLSTRPTSTSRPLQFFRRNKSATSPPAVTVGPAADSVAARLSVLDANRTPVYSQVRAGVDADVARYDFSPYRTLPIDVPNTVRLESVTAASPCAISPIPAPSTHMTSAVTSSDYTDSRIHVRNTPLYGVTQNASVAESQPSRFDSKLPRELQLQCFATLLDLHVAELAKAKRRAQGHSGESKERAIRYLENRWVGAMAGRRELFKLARVCLFTSAQ
jgi:hypothetical protein